MRSRQLAVAVFVAGVLAVPVAAQAEQAPRPGQLVVVAGLGPAGNSGDGGPARDARIEAGPLSVGGDGSVYLTGLDRVRRVTPDGVIDTVLTAGRGEQVRAAAVGPDGALLLTVETPVERQLRRVDGSGAVTVLATGAFDDVAVDGAGNAYVYDPAGKVLRVDPSGQVTRVGDTTLDYPGVRLAVSRDGAVYFTTRTDRASGELYALATSGPPRKLADSADRPPSGPAVAPDGTVYFIDGGRDQIMRVGADGTAVPVSPALHSMGEHLAVGPDGDLYFGFDDTLTGVHRVLRLVQHGEPARAEPVRPGRSPWADDAPGTVHTVAGNGERPPAGEKPRYHEETPHGGLAVGPDGTVYVAEPTRHQVRAIAPDGDVRRFAGIGRAGETGRYDDEAADRVVLAGPTAVAATPDGSVYVVAGRRLHRITPEGRISTVDAGSPTGDADLDAPAAIAVDTEGTLHYATYNAIWKLDADGRATLAVGYDNPGGRDDENTRPAHQTLLHNVRSVAVGPDGSVYYAQDGASVEVARPDGSVATVTGGHAAGFAGDGGPAAGGAVNNPLAVAIGPDGACYIADTYNNRIRRALGDISTVAGNGRRGDTGDGGPATSAPLTDPASVAVGPDGTLYALTGSDLVRAVAPDGVIRTVADLSPAKARRATDVPFGSVDGFAVGPDSTLYVTSATGLYVAGPDRELRPFEMAPPLITYSRYGPTVPPESAPLAVGADGSLYLAPNAALRVHPDGAVETLLGGGQDNRLADVPPEEWASPTDYTFHEGDPRDLAVAADGTVYLGTEDGVYARRPDGELTTVLKAGEHDLFGGLALDPDGKLYVITNLSRVAQVVDGKAVPVVAPAYGDERPKYDVSLEYPSDLAFTSDGTMFVSVGTEIHRFSPNGDTAVVHRGDKGPVTQLAVGPGDDLYFLQPESRQVRVLVRPVAAPEVSTGTASVPTGWIVFVVLVAGVGAGIFVMARRAARRG